MPTEENNFNYENWVYMYFIVVVVVNPISSKEHFGVESPNFFAINSRTIGIYIAEPNQWPFIGLLIQIEKYFRDKDDDVKALHARHETDTMDSQKIETAIKGMLGLNLGATGGGAPGAYPRGKER